MHSNSHTQQCYNFYYVLCNALPSLELASSINKLCHFLPEHRQMKRSQSLEALHCKTINNMWLALNQGKRVTVDTDMDTITDMDIIKFLTPTPWLGMLLVQVIEEHPTITVLSLHLY